MLPTELMMHATARIECTTAGGATSTGTGFFFNLFPQGEQSVPVLITNKHVIRGAVSGIINLTLEKAGGGPHESGRVQVRLNFDNGWIEHPDPNVDLVMLLCAQFLNEALQQNRKIFAIFLDGGLIWDDATNKANLTPVEDVLVVGYPDGIWDEVHNAPIFRKGITATSPILDFNNRREFLVDCAIFPGSSGSPVFLYNPSGWAGRNGSVNVGNPRVSLLGIIYAVALHMVTGEIKIIQAPTSAQPIAFSGVPNNLGICIKSSRILEFELELVTRGFTPPAGYKIRSSLPRF